MSINSLKTLEQFTSDEGQAFTVPALRWLIFNEDANGARELLVFPKIGRRRYVNPDRFFLFVELQNTGELGPVVSLIKQAKKQGGYLDPEQALARVRSKEDVQAA